MTVKSMLRTFSFNGLKLPDPDPKLSVDEVRGIFAHAYPGNCYSDNHGAGTSRRHVEVYV
jgi:PRTRC genetic system protein C